jgi:hypothetical protein
MTKTRGFLLTIEEPKKKNREAHAYASPILTNIYS